MWADGSGERRLTETYGQFADWSPDRRYLVVAGEGGPTVIRPDGSGRLDSRRFQPAHVPRLDAIITVLQPPERLAETLNERRATEPHWNPRGDRNAVARIACMANPLARIASRGRAVRWAALYEAAKFVYGHGKRMYGNLSPAERERLGQLMRKSRGRRSNLTEREQRRVWELVKKAATGS